MVGDSDLDKFRNWGRVTLFWIDKRLPSLGFFLTRNQFSVLKILKNGRLEGQNS